MFTALTRICSVSEDQEVAYSQEYVNQTVNHEQGVAALTDSFSQFGLSSEVKHKKRPLP